MTNPGPRDVDLAEWLDGIGFHPGNTELKQRAHEFVRLLAALHGTHLHQLLPAGRDKSLAFTHLEDVLMRANRALAIGGGPRDSVMPEMLNRAIEDAKRVLADLESVVPYDPRIAEYEQEQRGESTADPLAPLEPFDYVHEDGPSYVHLEMGIVALASDDGSSTPRPAARLATIRGKSEEGPRAVVAVYMEDPEVLENLASYALSMANKLRALRAR